MGVAELLFLINRGIMIGFKIHDRVQAGEMTPEEGLEEWKRLVAKINTEEERFDRLMGDD